MHLLSVTLQSKDSPHAFRLYERHYLPFLEFVVHFIAVRKLKVWSTSTLDNLSPCILCYCFCNRANGKRGKDCPKQWLEFWRDCSFISASSSHCCLYYVGHQEEYVYLVDKRLDNSNVGAGIFALNVMSINLPSGTTTRRSCTYVDTVAEVSRSRTIMMRSCGKGADTSEN